MLKALSLNPIYGKAEDTQVVAVSDSDAKLIQFYADERVADYSEPGFNAFFPELGNEYIYRKYFRKGGPLEMFNKVNEGANILSFVSEIPSREEYIDFLDRQKAGILAHYDQEVSSYRRV